MVSVALRVYEARETIRCSDGPLGELTDFIVEPTRPALDYLVVSIHGEWGRKRLIPFRLVRPAATGRDICLDCTVAEANHLNRAQEVRFPFLGGVPATDSGWDLGVQDFLLLPSQEAGAFVDYQPELPNVVQMYHRIPKGHVELRRESSVVSADGRHVATLAGLVVEGSRLTHLVVRRRRLWHRRPRWIPIAEVKRLRTDEVVVLGGDRALETAGAQNARR